MLEVIHDSGIATKWRTGEEVFEWWMEEETINGQLRLSDLEAWREDNFEE